MTEEEFQKRSGYEGNGWSKYQVMVLAQLRDQTELSKDVMEQLSEAREHRAVVDANMKNWIEQNNKRVDKLESQIEYVLNSKNGINDRLSKLEQFEEISKATKVKIGGLWALIGGVIVVIIDVIFNLLGYFSPKP